MDFYCICSQGQNIDFGMTITSQVYIVYVTVPAQTVEKKIIYSTHKVNFNRPSGHSEIILRWHLKRLRCALMSTTLPSINSFSFVILTFFPSSKACFIIGSAELSFEFQNHLE